MDNKRDALLNRAMRDDDLVGLSVVLKSRTGRSLNERGLRLSKANLAYFGAERQMFREAIRDLERGGFRILAEGRFGLSVAAPKRLVERFFRTKIDLKTVRIKHGGRSIPVRIPTAKLSLPGKFSRAIETIKLEQYPIPLESATPPVIGDYHLDVPDDVTRLLEADAVHACGYDGSGIRLCMIDDGFFPHAYYTSRGYDITLVPVGVDTMPEGKGHGTGIAANALAVAPRSEFIFVNNQLWIFSVATAAFRTAKDQNPDVITCSWGLNAYDAELAAEIIDAVNDGIVVAFACGNGGPVYFPGSMDEVISVGGAYPREGGGFEASSYASSGESPDHPGRQCPDVCGLVGQSPHGVLIMMPTVPGGYYDGEFAAYDGSAVDDGWMCASGTSSATPQVAGVAALMLQCQPTLLPEQIKTKLEVSATDISVGVSGSGEVAASGVDLATGHGLVNARRAVHAAGCSCSNCRWFVETCRITREVACVRYMEVCTRREFTVCPKLEGCVPSLMVGCRPSLIVGPGGCGPVSLIAPDFRDRGNEIAPEDILPRAVGERLARLTVPPTRGEHIRTLTSRAVRPSLDRKVIRTRRPQVKKLSAK